MRTILSILAINGLVSCGSETGNSNTSGSAPSNSGYSYNAELGLNGNVKKITEIVYLGYCVEKFGKWEIMDTQSVSVAIENIDEKGQIIDRAMTGTPDMTDTNYVVFKYSNGVYTGDEFINNGKVESYTHIKWINDTCYQATTTQEDGKVSNETQTILNKSYKKIREKYIRYNEAGEIDDKAVYEYPHDNSGYKIILTPTDDSPGTLEYKTTAFDDHNNPTVILLVNEKLGIARMITDAYEYY